MEGQPQPQIPPSQPNFIHPQQGAGDHQNLYRQPRLAVWGSGVPKKELSHAAKRQGAVSRRGCMNSHIALQSHSPCLVKTTNVGGKMWQVKL